MELRGLLTQLVQPYALEASRKGVALDLQLDPGLPNDVQTDPLRLGQILNNLLSNAIKFTASGAVTLTVQASGADPAWLHFAVRDSGIGMEPGVIARLFAPFMQADGSTTRNYGGTGLGLCICQRLAELLDGTLTVESQAGEGSVFTLNLPLVPASRPDSDLDAASLAVLRPLRPGRVLVADDDPSNRWLTQRQLQLLGLEVDTAENGRSALEKLRAGQYHLLVTDCHMPEMDGSALARAVRASSDPALSAIPIIGVTADATATQRARCLDAGMSEVAIKPVSRGHMHRLLSALGTAAHAPPPAIEPATGSPVFDPSAYQDLFEPGDPEGAGWLSEYLDGARDMLAKLQADLATGEPDRAAIAATAHRLAGASLSVGAASLGHAAKRIERAAETAARPALVEMQSALILHHGDGRAAIHGFLAGQPAGAAA